jgi:uncharacterized protein YfaS (alpha-2-macroglobulin family)
VVEIAMRRLLALLCVLLALAAPALAFEPPGLENDAVAYQQQLQRRFPAGATPQQRGQAEQRARTAQQRNDWAAAAAAWEERIGMGQAGPDQWLALAEAQLRRNPPEATRALQAGWRAFMQVPGGPPEIPSLTVMAEAMRRLDQPMWQLQALEAVVERAPQDAKHRAALAEARRAAGLLLRQVRAEPDAEPARACLAFTTAPARRDDWQPGDWVRAEPALPGMAVTKEGEQICVAGLPWGRTTRLVLRAGLPGEDGLRMMRDTPVNVAMPNRNARIVFDSRAFILPRGQAPAMTVATVNVAEMTLRVTRIGERNLLGLTRDWRPGEQMESWLAGGFAEDMGRVVWEGRVVLPPAEPNRLVRHAMPLPDSLLTAGPGMYVLLARPADGSRGRFRAEAAAAVLATDLGITAWRGTGGLSAQIRGFGDARPKPGARVALLARNNDILAEATTGADGLASFNAALLRGEGALAPAALQVFQGDDFASLDLETAAFDLSDRGAAGRPHPGPLDAFVWLDRGIYRPGETVRVGALLRDAGGQPADIPARLRVLRPNGQVFWAGVPERVQGAAFVQPVALSTGAPAGAWTVEVLADPDAPPIGRTTFRVDAFVPERMEVEAGPLPPALVGGQPAVVPLTARFLYGAPAAGLTGMAELRLVPDAEPFEAWRGWQFGLADEVFSPDLQSFEVPETDAQGRTTLTLNLPRAPDSTRPVKAEVAVTLEEPGGRGSSTRFTLPVRAQGTLLAIRPAFQGGAVDANAEAAFDIGAVNPAGEAIAATLRLRLVRERPDWRIVLRERVARYETVWRDEPVDSTDIQVAPGRPGRFARTLSFGRYRIEVTQPNGLAIASYRFRAGWAGGETAEVPDRVDLAADKRAYAAGDMARVRITPPFAGQASVAVLTDRLVSLRDVAVPEGGVEIEVPVDAAWGPGAHVAVTVFRAGQSPAGRPARALGLAWIGLDPAARRLEVAIEAPDLARPNARVDVPVRIAGAAGGSAMLTLAAVDEGILRLTRFRSPDPVEHFLARRRLGLDIRDDYGRLIAPAEGEAATLRQGGDELAGSAVDIPQRLVALFEGPVAVGADGVARVPLDLPDFAGELRLMVVAWDGARIGAASKPMTVREAVVAEALLPRFLAPGDEVRLPVLLHNIELPAGEIVATLTASGAIELTGPARLAQSLATGARATPATALRATVAGEGVLRVAVTGPNGFNTQREARITVRSSRAPVTDVATRTLAPGETAPVPVPSDRFIAGTWQARATWGAPVRYDPAALVTALLRFPLDCVEQASSRVMALVYAPQNPDTAADDAAALGRHPGSPALRRAFRLLERGGRDAGMGEPVRDGGAAARPRRRRDGAAGGAGRGAARGGGRAGSQRGPAGAGRGDGLSRARPRARRAQPAGCGAATGGEPRCAADAAGARAARQRLRAGRRHAARDADLRQRARRDGAAVLGLRLRQRAARPAGDGGAAEGKRRRAGPAAEPARAAAGRGSAALQHQHAGTGLGRRGGAGAGARRAAGAHRARWARPARRGGGRRGVGGQRHRAESRPVAGGAGGVGGGRADLAAARGGAGDARGAALLRDGRAAAEPGCAARRHGFRRAAGGARADQRASHGDGAAGSARGVGDHRPAAGGRGAGHALAWRADRARQHARARRPLRRGGDADAGTVSRAACGAGARGDGGAVRAAGDGGAGHVSAGHLRAAEQRADRGAGAG